MTLLLIIAKNNAILEAFDCILNQMLTLESTLNCKLFSMV